MIFSKFPASVFALGLLASGFSLSTVPTVEAQEQKTQSQDSQSEADGKRQETEPKRTASEQASKAKLSEQTADRLSVGEMIQKAYQSSTTAKTQKDFTLTIKHCDHGLERKISEPQKKYLNQLKSWALVSRAKLFPAKKSVKDDNEETTVEVDLASNQLAIADCTTAIGSDSDNWKAFAHRAKRHFILGDTTAALQDLDGAIRRQTTEPRLWFNRAELFFEQGKYEIAAADYSEAIKLDGNDLQAMTGRGHCYLRLNKPDLALADYDEVVERARKSATAYLNRAELHLKLKRFKLAGEDYREALTRDQSLAQAYRGVAWMYATSMKDKYYNPTVADRSVKRAIELDGRETAENLVILAAAQAAGGEYSMARDTMKRVREAQKLSKDTLEKLQFLEQRKWYLAGTGLK